MIRLAVANSNRIVYDPPQILHPTELHNSRSSIVFPDASIGGYAQYIKNDLYRRYPHLNSIKSIEILSLRLARSC